MADFSREQIIDKHEKGDSLERANLKDLSLDNVALEKVMLCRADLAGASFEGSDLRKADLSFANLCEAYLGRANLEGANLYQADLEDSNLEEANLQFADLSRANLAGAKLERANLRGARLSYAQLEVANLGKADLEEAQLDNANLCESYLGGARLIRANLQHANGGWASFEEADLTNADLRGCHLREANLAGMLLTGSKLYGLEATPEQLSEVLADWVDFSADGNGLTKVNGAGLADSYRRLRDGLSGMPATVAWGARRYFGQGDILRNATLEFDKEAEIEIESYFENCSILLGPGARLTIGPAGVLAGCQIVGEGEIVILGKFYEKDHRPGIIGPLRLFVAETGTAVTMVQQPMTLTQFGFEHGCALSLTIRKSQET
jgi:uncharacterized protein YjbI with pentapeptide repeats